MRPPGQRRWRAAVAGTAVLAVGGFLATPTATAQTGANPAQLGAWSAPFEEGGSAQARCERRATDGLLECKPAAVSTTVLPNGKFIYWMGIEGQQNTERAAAVEHFEAEDSESRVLDLTSGTPQWSNPVNNTGGSVNPEIVRSDQRRLPHGGPGGCHRRARPSR